METMTEQRYGMQHEENDTICDFLGGKKNAIDAEADVLQ